nr:uncharacterized protein LOC121132415 isoform X2 [Lepeophtheirus salmonis]
MGQSESSDTRLMYANVMDFAIKIRPPDKMNIINAGRDVVSIFQEILNSECLISCQRFKHQSSTFKMYIKGYPFSHQGKSTLYFKVVFLKILDRLYQSLEMVPFISSDLSLINDTSTIFFKKVKKVDQSGKYACIAPSGIDSLYLLSLPSNAVKNIIEEVDNSWGIYSEVEEKISNCFKIKMNGSPWGPGGKGEKATKIRRLLLKIFAIMKSSQYRYVTNINMKGTTDNLFFRFDPTLVPDNNLAFVLYLSKKNRLRFIDGPENVTTQIKNTINQFWSGGVTCERIYNDALEFKISGCPWSAHSYAAANSRMLTSIILKEIRNLGYQTIATLDISRRSDDKSIFVFGGGSGFQISPDLNIKWTCLYFCGRNKLMLVGVHEDVVSILQDCLKPLKEDNGKKEGDIYLWKFTSNVFSYGNNSSKEIFCIILLSIYRRMQAIGWFLTSSADVSSKTIERNDTRESYDAHSWYFLCTTSASSKKSKWCVAPRLTAHINRGIKSCGILSFHIIPKMSPLKESGSETPRGPTLNPLILQL